MPDPTTAAELHALVKSWPRDAWPKGVGLLKNHKTGADCWKVDRDHDTDTDDWSRISTQHAAMLFHTSGTNHLISNGYHSFEWGYNSDTELVTLKLYDREHSAPTLFLALHAAILATTKEQA